VKTFWWGKTKDLVGKEGIYAMQRDMGHLRIKMANYGDVLRGNAQNEWKSPFLQGVWQRSESLMLK
jgi:hypothetical protein